MDPQKLPDVSPQEFAAVVGFSSKKIAFLTSEIAKNVAVFAVGVPPNKRDAYFKDNLEVFMTALTQLMPLMTDQISYHIDRYKQNEISLDILKTEVSKL